MHAATVDRFTELLASSPCTKTVDITGGAPEMHPEFRRIVASVRAMGRHVIDRCNLTILGEAGQESTAVFLAEHQVEIIASLPCYGPKNVDQQRGSGVFEQSIQQLQRLNELGYGQPGSNRVLNLVYNPIGPMLPPNQLELEQAYKGILAVEYDIAFNHLYTITNVPIARFKNDLRRSGQLDEYLALLASKFNRNAVGKLMCTEIVSIDWQGRLYDCDFNQMLNCAMPGPQKTIWEIQNFNQLTHAPIATGTHCMACTAGSGSSCGGALD